MVEATDLSAPTFQEKFAKTYDFMDQYPAVARVAKEGLPEFRVFPIRTSHIAGNPSPHGVGLRIESHIISIDDNSKKARKLISRLKKQLPQAIATAETDQEADVTHLAIAELMIRSYPSREIFNNSHYEWGQTSRKWKYVFTGIDQSMREILKDSAKKMDDKDIQSITKLLLGRDRRQLHPERISSTRTADETIVIANIINLVNWSRHSLDFETSRLFLKRGKENTKFLIESNDDHPQEKIEKKLLKKRLKNFLRSKYLDLNEENQLLKKELLEQLS